MKNQTITYMTISLLFLYGLLAQKTLAEAATPDPQIALSPYILINKVGFKNTQADTIVLKVIDDMNNGNGSTIKGLSLKDDSVFFKLKQDIYVRTDEKIFISFKNDTEEIKTTSDGLQINLTKNGLTGTTEQLILLNNNQKIVDAICWTNNKPTESEISEFEHLFEQSEWNNNDISSCINSNDISKDQIIQRKNPTGDTNSKNDWEIKKLKSNDSYNEDENKTNNDENINSIKTVKEEKKVKIEPITKICDDAIVISEFLPNPAGKDSKQEWIEIMNSSGADCSLYGWQVDDQEGGSNKYTIVSHETIPHNEYLLLPSWKTKLNLNNRDDSIRLFNQNDKLIDEIIYEDAPEDQSYALNNETNDFLWTEKPTPLTKNVFLKPKEKLEKSTNNKNEQTKSSKDKNKIENGTLSNQLRITEIFPNPKGEDKGREWIEIFNDSDTQVKLGNWKLKTENKSYNFKNITIKEKKYLVLYSKDLGFSLKNTKGKFILSDFDNNEISSVTYDDSFEAKSFMEITNIENGELNKSWIWTEDTTPGDENYTIYTYNGIINKFDKNTGDLTLSINNGQVNAKTLNILASLSGEDLVNFAFNVGSQIKVTVKQENNKLILEDYILIKDATSNDDESNKDSSNLLYIIISSIPPLGFLSYSAIKKLGLIKIV